LLVGAGEEYFIGFLLHYAIISWIMLANEITKQLIIFIDLFLLFFTNKTGFFLAKKVGKIQFLPYFGISDARHNLHKQFGLVVVKSACTRQSC